jgi:S-formylglutathione hydrolase FrmB
MRLRTAIPAALAASAALAAGPVAPARAMDECSRYAPSAVADSPRIERHAVEGIAVSVLLPRTYASEPRRRYPVLYLLHPAVSHELTWLAETGLAEFTAGLRAAEEAIVVMPDGGSLGFYTDWADGSHLWETFHVRQLPAWVERTYRTLAERRHRAVAGFSMGGFGAMHYAVRHPERFGAAAAFSGAVSMRDWSASAVALGLGPSQAGCDGRPPSAASPFGEPFGEQAYAEHNPVDLAPRLRGMTVFLSRANGVPCPGDERGTYSAAHAGEPAIAPMTERMHEALDAAGVEHSVKRFDCGLHVMPNAERGLREFWPRMAETFGGAGAAGDVGAGPGGAPARSAILAVWRPRASARLLNRRRRIRVALRVDEPLRSLRVRLVERRGGRIVATGSRRRLARDARVSLRLVRRARPGPHRVLVSASRANGGRVEARRGLTLGR